MRARSVVERGERPIPVDADELRQVADGGGRVGEKRIEDRRQGTTAVMQLMAERERELVAAAAHQRLVRELPPSHRRLRIRMAAALKASVASKRHGTPVVADRPAGCS